MSFLNYDNLSDEQIINILISDGDISDLENLSDDEDAVNEAAIVNQAGKKNSRLVSCVPIYW